jgi:hypothetical protein
MLAERRQQVVEQRDWGVRVDGGALAEGFLPSGLESRGQFLAHSLGGVGVQAAHAGNLGLGVVHRVAASGSNAEKLLPPRTTRPSSSASASPEDRVKVPVPLLVTAQDWDPRRQPVRDWLTGRLQQTYPLFAGQTGTANAAGLIDTGKITVILDGLDEIAADLWPVALQALSQASFRVVVLSRTAEMASAASQHGVLQGAVAVELRAIAPATAANYLERVQLDPPPGGMA